ncbi:DUF2345 domain-containing protein, partial [Denitromonas iodatirespirans]|uniref:DUF2345 domain-containing protein n=1 Tax=Denitromonas iodatirespirans TaxID=2795389 RepID=UPI001E38D250
QIVLKAGQSSVTLSGADITFACPGKFSVKGGGNAFEGPGRGAVSQQTLPDSRVRLFDEGFVLVDELTGNPLAGRHYRIRRQGGEWEYGTTDDKGKTHIALAADTETLDIEIDA